MGKEEASRKIYFFKNLKPNTKKSTTHNLWDGDGAVLRGKFKSSHAHIRRKDPNQSSWFTLGN